MASREQMLGQPSFNQYAAGRKRYGGGTSFAATSGPVDPTGYVDREARNKARVNAYKLALRDRKNGAYGSANIGKIGGI